MTRPAGQPLELAGAPHGPRSAVRTPPHRQCHCRCGAVTLACVLLLALGRGLRRPDTCWQRRRPGSAPDFHAGTLYVSNVRHAQSRGDRDVCPHTDQDAHAHGHRDQHANTDADRPADALCRRGSHAGRRLARPRSGVRVARPGPDCSSGGRPGPHRRRHVATPSVVSATSRPGSRRRP